MRWHFSKVIARCGMTQSQDIVLASFIGDALSLGPHWIYDPAEISKKLGKIAGYHAPLASYHPGKAAGDFTHYGDQMLVLLRSLAAVGHLDLSHHTQTWRDFWENPATRSYRDGATKSTLAALQAGSAPSAAASTSQDIAGAAKIAPLFLLGWENDGELIAAARALSGLTHRAPCVTECAEFFVRVALAVRSGSEIDSALLATLGLGHWCALPPEWGAAALRSSKSSASDAAALADHGLACDTASAFPSICHLLLKYPAEPCTALLENASAGGDSAARGMILGMVYGAKFPLSIWPATWLDEMTRKTEIFSLIEKVKHPSR